MMVCVCGGGEGRFFIELASLLVLCAPAMVNVQLNQCGPLNQGFCHECVRVLVSQTQTQYRHTHKTLGYEDNTVLTGH